MKNFKVSPPSCSFDKDFAKHVKRFGLTEIQAKLMTGKRMSERGLEMVV